MIIEMRLSSQLVSVFNYAFYIIPIHLSLPQQQYTTLTWYAHNIEIDLFVHLRLINCLLARKKVRLKEDNTIN